MNIIIYGIEEDSIKIFDYFNHREDNNIVFLHPDYDALYFDNENSNSIRKPSIMSTT
jgi:hypothetical protein